MSVYPIKTKQRGPKCSWCEAKATHRGFMFGKHSCADHLPELTVWDRRETAPDHSDAAFYGGFA